MLSPKVVKELLLENPLLLFIYGVVGFAALVMTPLSMAGFVIVVQKYMRFEEDKFFEILSGARIFFWRIVFFIIICSVFMLPVIIVNRVSPETQTSTLYFLFYMGYFFTISLFTAVVIQGIVIDDLKTIPSIRNSIVFVKNNFKPILMTNLLIFIIPLVIKIFVLANFLPYSKLPFEAAFNLKTYQLFNSIKFNIVFNNISSFLLTPIQYIIFSLIYYRKKIKDENAIGGLLFQEAG